MFYGLEANGLSPEPSATPCSQTSIGKLIRCRGYQAPAFNHFGGSTAVSCFTGSDAHGTLPMMISAPGTDRLTLRQRQLYIEQYEKDLKFIQLFYLLLNKFCPIKNVDLVWTESGPSGRASLRHLGISDALLSSSSKLLTCSPVNPHPDFCNLINDFGRQEAESCGVSDKAGEARVRQTGKAHMYRCNFGLIDIAVPIVVDGAQIATLLTGQVLREPPRQRAWCRSSVTPRT